MRGVRASDGVRMVMDDPFEFGQARAAIGAGAQRPADRLDVAGLLRLNRVPDHIEADAEARTDHRPDVGETLGGTAGEQHAALQVTGGVALEQTFHRVPLRRGFGGADKQHAVEFSVAERRPPIDAARKVDEFGELGTVQQCSRTLAPELWTFWERHEIANAAVHRDARPPGFLRQLNGVSAQDEAAEGELDRRDRRRRRLLLGLARMRVGVWRYQLASTRR